MQPRQRASVGVDVAVHDREADAVLLEELGEPRARSESFLVSRSTR
jgi:hypothetical protein